MALTRSTRTAIPTLVLALVVCPTMTAASDSVGEALNRCATISSDADRLVCYDALAAVLRPGDESSASLPAVSAAPVGPTPITDDVGLERVEGADSDARGEEPVFTAHVSRCQESAQSGQTFFVFDNGQVWKQTNYRRLNLRSCDFDVEISEDTFGYEMYIPSRDRSVRVSRTR